MEKFKEFVNEMYQFYLQSSPAEQLETQQMVYEKLREMAQDQDLAKDVFHRFKDAQDDIEHLVCISSFESFSKLISLSLLENPSLNVGTTCSLTHSLIEFSTSRSKYCPYEDRLSDILASTGRSDLVDDIFQTLTFNIKSYVFFGSFLCNLEKINYEGNFPVSKVFFWFTDNKAVRNRMQRV